MASNSPDAYVVVRAFSKDLLLEKPHYPYDDLEPGDAFLVPYVSEDPHEQSRQRNRLNASGQNRRKRNPALRYSVFASDGGFYVVRRQ